MSVRLLVFATLALACAGSDLVLPGEEGRPAAIVIVSGNHQSGPAGRTLDDPFIVEVTNEHGQPAAGVTVEWEAEEGDVDPTSVLTGTDGRAMTRRVLGSDVGVQMATAAVSGVGTVEFIATATDDGDGGGGGGRGRGRPSRMVIYGGNNQMALVCTTVSVPPAVVVSDDDDDGVAGVEVMFTVVEGGGRVVGTTVATNESGIAAVGSWTLGSIGGTNRLRARIDRSGVSGNPLTFTATATVSLPQLGRLVFWVQPSDTEEDERIEPAVRVAVVDGGGNVIVGRGGEVRLELSGGSSRGRLRGSTSSDLQQGVATFDNLRVDREGRGYRIRASLNGLAPIESNAFNIIDD